MTVMPFNLHIPYYHARPTQKHPILVIDYHLIKSLMCLVTKVVSNYV